MRFPLHVGIGICLLSSLAGCMDGPFYQMKRMNPYFQSEWKRDRELGPTYDERLKELKLLETQLATMDSAEQQAWAEKLGGIIQDDASPEMRSRAIQVAARLPQPAIEKALNSASADDVAKVRITAAKAWRQRGGDAARDMLLSMATSDESNSVRQSAVESLASFNEPEVMRTLSNLLDDSSPAIQYEVVKSLATMTGEDLEGDIEGWKELVASRVPAQAPSNPLDISAPLGANNQVLPASGFNNLPLPNQR